MALAPFIYADFPHFQNILWPGLSQIIFKQRNTLSHRRYEPHSIFTRVTRESETGIRRVLDALQPYLAYELIIVTTAFLSQDQKLSDIFSPTSSRFP